MRNSQNTLRGHSQLDQLYFYLVMQSIWIECLFCILYQGYRGNNKEFKPSGVHDQEKEMNIATVLVYCNLTEE